MRALGLAVLVCFGTTACGAADEAPLALAAAPAGFSRNPVAPPSEQIELTTAPVVERVRRQYADRLAGLYFQPEQQRIVVRLKGPEAVAPETHAVGDATLRVEFQPGAEHTYSKLNEVMTSSAGQIDALLPTAHARYVDERTGEIVLGVTPGTGGVEARRAQLAQALGAPVRIEVQEAAVPQRPTVR